MPHGPKSQPSTCSTMLTVIPPETTKSKRKRKHDRGQFQKVNAPVLNQQNLTQTLSQRRNRDQTSSTCSCGGHANGTDQCQQLFVCCMCRFQRGKQSPQHMFTPWTNTVPATTTHTSTTTFLHRWKKTNEQKSYLTPRENKAENKAENKLSIESIFSTYMFDRFRE